MLRNNQGQFNAEAMEVISNYLTNSRELFSDEKHAQFVRSRDELIQLKVQQAQSMGVAAEILSNVKSGDYAFACNKFIQVWNFILSSQNETNVSMRVYDFYQFILGWIQAAPKTEQEKQRFQHFIQTLRSEKN
ncbi:MAG: hypothetical protein HWD59_07480 [Coxiellaceae bacterium]|nr:MAG: hypothetical protein HWD59_07480 [Coxiellaceae bacterium]